MLEAAYEMLRTTRPIKGWRLPPADNVEFVVTRSLEYRGWHTLKNGVSRIHISCKAVGSLAELTRTMAHEMVHQYEDGWLDNYRSSTNHSRRWHQLAKSVCQWHCWDYPAF